MGHKTIQKTNHCILLTNVGIKRCIKTSFKTYFIRGGRVPTRQVPYRQQCVLSKSDVFILMLYTN